MIKNILIIDDSALMRRVLSDIIESDDRFRVADMAINGLDGLIILQKKAAVIDAVLLDINMPRMNGLEFLAEIKKQNIKATVIIVSTIAKKDAKETILALELGAIDFVTKPESYEEVKSNIFSNRILDCVSVATNLPEKSSLARRVPIEVEKPVRETLTRKARSDGQEGDGNLVAIACSTGGPKALHTLIPMMPANLNASVLVVQHMPEGFTKSLADRLNDLSAIRVKEAEDGDIVEKAVVYIAKGGSQMRIYKTPRGEYQLSVTKESPRNGLLPCADIMFESLVDTDFDHITCVVLTGMGSDGTSGIKELKKKNKIHVIAQSEETCIVYGMPKVITEAGLVNEVVGLSEVSSAIIKNVGVQ